MKITLPFILLAVVSCNDNVEFPASSSKTPTEINNLNRFNAYIDCFYSNQEDSLDISLEIKETYIQDALEKLNGLYSYENYSELEYKFNEVLYKSPEIVAVSFNINGDDGWNMHDADFMVTYDINNGALIDVLQIGSSTDFESYVGKGYNSVYSLNYELLNVEDKDIAFIIQCVSQREYYNFNESYYSLDEISEMTAEEPQMLEYTVNVLGEISESL